MKKTEVGTVSSCGLSTKRDTALPTTPHQKFPLKLQFDPSLRGFLGYATEQKPINSQKIKARA
jgi:hypothetical protein